MWAGIFRVSSIRAAILSLVRLLKFYGFHVANLAKLDRGQVTICFVYHQDLKSLKSEICHQCFESVTSHSGKEIVLTLSDLMKLVVHRWKIVVFIPLLCAILAALVLAAGGSNKYTAEAQIVVNDPTGTVSTDILVATVVPIAEQVAAEDYGEIAVSVEAPAAGGNALQSRIVVVTAVGSEEAECINAVNDIANRATEKAAEFFAEMDGAYQLEQMEERSALAELLGGSKEVSAALLSGLLLNKDYSHCTFIARDSPDAEGVSSNALKYILASMAIGLFLAICYVAFAAAVKKPIKSKNDIVARFDYPILAWPMGGNEGDRLWANLKFALPDDTACISIIPLREGESAYLFDLLKGAASKMNESVVSVSASLAGAYRAKDDAASLNVIECQPLAQDASSIYVAREVDSVIVCARLWLDNLDVLADTLDELCFAGAKIAGIVLLPEKRISKKSRV